MSTVYTDVDGIKWLYYVCPPVRKIIHSLKLVDYLHVQADNPLYNYYVLDIDAVGLVFVKRKPFLVSPHYESMEVHDPRGKWG